MLGSTRVPAKIPIFGRGTTRHIESIINGKIPSEFPETKKYTFQFCTSFRNVRGSNKEEMMSKLEVKHYAREKKR